MHSSKTHAIIQISVCVKSPASRFLKKTRLRSAGFSVRLSLFRFAKAAAHDVLPAGFVLSLCKDGYAAFCLQAPLFRLQRRICGIPPVSPAFSLAKTDMRHSACKPRFFACKDGYAAFRLQAPLFRLQRRICGILPLSRCRFCIPKTSAAPPLPQRPRGALRRAHRRTRFDGIPLLFCTAARRMTLRMPTEKIHICPFSRAAERNLT